MSTPLLLPSSPATPPGIIFPNYRRLWGGCLAHGLLAIPAALVGLHLPDEVAVNFWLLCGIWGWIFGFIALISWGSERMSRRWARLAVDEALADWQIPGKVWNALVCERRREMRMTLAGGLLLAAAITWVFKRSAADADGGFLLGGTIFVVSVACWRIGMAAVSIRYQFVEGAARILIARDALVLPGFCTVWGRWGAYLHGASIEEQERGACLLLDIRSTSGKRNAIGRLAIPIPADHRAEAAEITRILNGG